MFIRNEGLNDDFVLVVVCPEETILAVIDCVEQELGLDHYILGESNTVLVRVNAFTLNVAAF